MSSYSVSKKLGFPVLIRWDNPNIWTFDPRVEGEWRLSPEKSEMLWGQGDWVWYDDISEEEAMKYMEEMREEYRKAVEQGDIPPEKEPAVNVADTQKKEPKKRTIPDRIRPRFLCHIYDMDEACEIRKSFRSKKIKEYGDCVRLPDGTKLHDNLDTRGYTAPQGNRELVRCNKCGALLLIQNTCDPNIYEGFEFLHDWIPVASEEEANLLNILLTGPEFTEYPFCHIQATGYYGCSWTDGEEPSPNDPEKLKDRIREKYADVNREELEKLISEAGKGGRNG